MEPQMIKKVNITIDKLQNNKPCSLSKQGLLLYHGFRHLFCLTCGSPPFFLRQSYESGRAERGGEGEALGRRHSLI